MRHAVAAAALAVGLGACAGEGDRGTRAGLCGPASSPVEVWNVGVDDGVAAAAEALWPPGVFVAVGQPSGEAATWIMLDVQPLPLELGPDAAGATWIEADDRGRIASCQVLISPDVARRPGVYTRTVAHHLGHCLGLDDDADDLEPPSVMAERPVEGAVVTEQDWAIVEEGCGE